MDGRNIELRRSRPLMDFLLMKFLWISLLVVQISSISQSSARYDYYLLAIFRDSCCCVATCYLVVCLVHRG